MSTAEHANAQILLSLSTAEHDTLEFSLSLSTLSMLSAHAQCSEHAHAQTFQTLPCRVYSDGAYDVFHSGHARQLMQAKNFFPNVTLIAGVHSNKEIHRVKGQTVNTDDERVEAVRHNRYVDEVLFDVPFEYSIEFFDKYQIDFIAHDDLPYTLISGPDPYDLPKRLNMFLPTQRTEGISTSDLVTRVVRNYDSYVRRNLKRGYDLNELNVGTLTQARIHTENLISSIFGSSFQMISKMFGAAEESS